MKLQANDKKVVTYLFDGVECYVTIYNSTKNKYTLYKIVDGDYQKLKTADEPLFDDIVEKDRSK